MRAQPEPVRCPDCGAELGPDAATGGLCPRCLLSLALMHSVLEVEPDLESGAQTLDRPTTGQILGERYQMRELLGRGGMGEVWRAFDLKLRVDVALKSVRTERISSDRAHELLRQEVRSAREVVSPNVCRIFDLVVEEGRELVSMEYIDGTTLSEALRERGPLELQEAREIASQFLAGLEAIHRADLVHRDFKPENVMLTRAGRVVVMDFGLAKDLEAPKTDSISGTPGYMAPEQARGETVDARADVYAAGVVLAEMLTVGSEGGTEARRALWKGVRETPPHVPDGPWAGVLRQALDPRPEGRPASARALARALEEVTLRLPGFEEKRPYPGLASFTEEDAEYFFGREAEVEAVWKKLKRPRLLALLGPSGTGKSSFVRAGLLATLPPGWVAVVATPGHRPFHSLARALVPAFSGEADVMEEFLGFEEPDTAVGLVSKWRQRHEHALIVVDQFEELFTLNPPEVQTAFSELLGRLVLEADAHVLLSLRDDFLFHCHSQESLAPAFADLTPLGTLGESALRRALVQPALACGYRFEDEALVEDMVEEVVRERGALPLLAFAASRLWERRDRDRGLLTREAYREIGGVAGALAQHAEATLENIGTHRTPLVRELFRNLMTAQGTRAVREREELLSVFEDRDRAAAAEVLGALVDSRLLTSFERAGDETGESHQEIEIIHESLLSRWPRLVRWQTQDADGAQLRDQLRQAAQAWRDRGQPEDLLWSGTAYRDLTLWQERYTGGLTATEDAFARASTRRASRQRRRRRIALATLVSVAAGVAVATSVLWRQSEAARERAEAETRRAEANRLLTLGEVELERYPTGALAYAMKSLELADTEGGRLLALRTLQRAQTARIVRVSLRDGGAAGGVDFSPDGEWVAIGGYQKTDVLRRDGSCCLSFGGFRSGGQGMMQARFSPDGRRLVANQKGQVRVWSFPEGRELRQAEADSGPSGLKLWNDGFLTLTTVGDEEVVRWWPFGPGEPRLIGTTGAFGGASVSASLLAYPRGRAVHLRSLDDWEASPRVVAQHPERVATIALDPEARLLATSDVSRRIRLWPVGDEAPQPGRILDTSGYVRRFDPTGRWLSAQAAESPEIHLVDLHAPEGTAPLALRRGDVTYWNRIDFDSSGEWLVTAHATDVALWWLGGQRSRVLTGHEDWVMDVVFTPDGRRLVSTSRDGTVRMWPLSPSSGEASRVVFRAPLSFPGMAIDPSGRRLLVSGRRGRVYLVPLDGGPARELSGFSPETEIVAVAFGDDGRLAAAAPHIGPPEEKVVRVWDVETGDVRMVGRLPDAGAGFEGGVRNTKGLRFVGPHRIVASSFARGVVSFDVRTGESTLLTSRPNHAFRVSLGGTFGVGWLIDANQDSQSLGVSELLRFDLAGGPATPLSGFPRGLGPVSAFDPSDRWLAVGALRSKGGIVYLGSVSGGDPHMLLGHEGDVWAAAFSPDGRWLATAGSDQTIRLWPVPDVSQTPFHRRPFEDVMRILRSHTNLRAVADPESATGYTLEPGPFPGWAEPPEPW